jgi:hypothetical protein
LPTPQREALWHTLQPQLRHIHPSHGSYGSWHSGWSPVSPSKAKLSSLLQPPSQCNRLDTPGIAYPALCCLAPFDRWKQLIHSEWPEQNCFLDAAELSSSYHKNRISRKTRLHVCSP